MRYPVPFENPNDKCVIVSYRQGAKAELSGTLTRKDPDPLICDQNFAYIFEQRFHNTDHNV